MDELNANELTRKRLEKERIIFAEYIRIYMKCNEKIKEADALGLNSFVYNVPHFSPNVPAYKLSSCEKVIEYKLSKNDFKVYRISPGKLEISWKLPDFNDIILLKEEETEKAETFGSGGGNRSGGGSDTDNNLPLKLVSRRRRTYEETETEDDGPLSLDKLSSLTSLRKK
jgi:hypothetical protein